MVNIPKQNLRTPGPTPVPSDIVEAMSNPMIDHRGPEFHEIIEIATRQLKQVFMTNNDLMILTASGTGALEAAIVNTLSPGDKVLSASAGSFGDRFTEMVETFGADVQRLDFEWGSPIEPEAIRSALRADPGIKAVLVTHNETSTGVTHPLQQISEVVKGEFQKLLLVDAVSSLACVPLPVDGWNCDVVGTASQKGFMIPPGLAFITMSETAWEASETSTMPSFYFDLKAARSYLESGQTPFTPNVALMYGLITALDNLLEEGMENVYERHARISQITRDGIKDLGLDLLVSDEAYASNTVTAIKVPEGVDGGRLRSLVREEHNVVLAGGQGKLSGSIFRIGHLGHITREDIEEVLGTLKTVFPKVGFRAG